ncbi:MAG: arsenate reductase family protein [Clostridia bacterium]|nr:arsenate reductase family protein [Clostridia bacterium]MBR0407321.1 arsenate reductase family protein [Clostridia bacterium]
MKPLFICYEKCTTCQKAKKWLEQNSIDYDLRPIKEQNPTAEELRAWQKQSGLPLRKFFNTSGMLYREMNLKDKLSAMTDEEMLSLLSTDGMLVKRPLLITENTAIPGFKADAWEAALK